MNQPERPYSRLETDDLSKLVDERRNDRAFLSEILQELLFRKRKVAVELRSVIHQRIQELGGYFVWPPTNTDEEAGNGTFEIDRPKVGLLKQMGYQVGLIGVSDENRRDALDAVFCEDLAPRKHPSHSAAYVAEWGPPESPLRLQKMANSIATFTANMKRNWASRSDHSIIQWESDLAYLKQKYYVGRFHFDWPSTTPE